MSDCQTVRRETGNPRVRLIEASIRLLEAGGPEAVQARKLAAEIGMSTMAVYTHFGGMSGLLEAIVRQGFLRLAAHVQAIPDTENPMADFFAKGLAYRDWALKNSQLYRLMFGLTGARPAHLEQDLTVAGTISTLPEGQAAFDVMVNALDRVKAAGQVDPVDPVSAAGQFLSATHGYVLLEIAGYFGAEGNGFPWVFGPLALSVMVGLGAVREDAERAAIAALAVFGIT
jgi:AcrR family transcriptional regulator